MTIEAAGTALVNQETAASIDRKITLYDATCHTTDASNTEILRRTIEKDAIHLVSRPVHFSRFYAYTSTT